MDLVSWIKEAGGQKGINPVARPLTPRVNGTDSLSNTKQNFGADYHMAPLAQDQKIHATSAYGPAIGGDVVDSAGNAIHISQKSNTLHLQGKNNSVQYLADNGKSTGNKLTIEGDQNRIAGYNGANYDNSIVVSGNQNIVLMGVGANHNQLDVMGEANRIQLTSQATHNQIAVKGDQVHLNILGSTPTKQPVHSEWEIALVGDNYSLSIVNGHVQLEFKESEKLRYEVMIDEETKRIVVEPKKEDSTQTS
jgi:hypothetical protein